MHERGGTVKVQLKNKDQRRELTTLQAGVSSRVLSFVKRICSSCFFVRWSSLAVSVIANQYVR